MPRIKFTPATVKKLPTGMHWDSEVTGLGIRVTDTGNRKYVFKYRLPSGRVRKPNIGRVGGISLSEVRTTARKWAAKVELGQDPQAELDEAKQQMTVSELCETYMDRHSLPKKKPRSSTGDRRMIDRTIKPTFGRKGLKELSVEDITRKHHTMKDTPFVANRMVALIRHMLNMAEKWGYIPRGSNPARFVEFYPEKPRDRCLSTEEIQRLNAVLTRYENSDTYHVAMIRLLILTGARRNEIQTLRWEWIDLENARIRLPDSKTGAKTIYLNDEAVHLLKTLPRIDGNPHVICGRLKGAHLAEPYKLWIRARKEAALEEVRLHDLRHTFASHAVSSGASLPTIGRLLGHKSTATTQRYAHLADKTAVDEAERMGKLLGGIMKGPAA